MQNFQSILIAIGILAIAGVLIHGFLLNRKNKLALKAEQEEKESEQIENIESEQSSATIKEDIEHVVFSSTEEKDEPEMFEFIVDNHQNIDSDPVIKSHSTLDHEVEIGATQADIELSPVNNDAAVKDEFNNNQEQTKIQNDIFIFNVVTREDKRLGGHELLQFFLTSGFRFGEMNIFHRHEHSDGTGEVLFSIANMMAPGTFDLDHMEQFSSQGISFFLTAPNDKISVNKAFDMMLRAVEQIADEFNCDVLNEQRELLTKEQFIEYRHRLKQYS
ncbi:cell division protein ZipA [Psychromonas sp. RZ22]|uniref:cell division protein ZipA n=1 Tax=Psychromonas algarum TaxID=2555643 RepID=UPI001068C267|nr:cell division protein ZipA [Psychromonas sp. RZ22]TEW54960.1 cell division protein ZipA [Psychromonas sp. RZ22]